MDYSYKFLLVVTNFERWASSASSLRKSSGVVGEANGILELIET